MTGHRSLDAQSEDDLRISLCKVVRSSEYLSQWLQRPFNSAGDVKVCGDGKAWPWEECAPCRDLAARLVNLRNGNPLYLSDPATGKAPVAPRES